MTRFEWDFPYTSQRMPVLAANAVAKSIRQNILSLSLLSGFEIPFLQFLTQSLGYGSLNFLKISLRLPWI